MAAVGCLAFDPICRRLVSFDADRTVSILSDLRDGLASGFRLLPDTLVVALAADCQQIEDWPDQAFGFAEADLVITPTRAVVLGTGETREITHEHRT